MHLLITFQLSVQRLENLKMSVVYCSAPLHDPIPLDNPKNHTALPYITCENILLLVFHRKDLCEARVKPKMNSNFQMKYTAQVYPPLTKSRAPSSFVPESPSSFMPESPSSLLPESPSSLLPESPSSLLPESP